MSKPKHKVLAFIVDGAIYCPKCRNVNPGYAVRVPESADWGAPTSTFYGERIKCTGCQAVVGIVDIPSNGYRHDEDEDEDTECYHEDGWHSSHGHRFCDQCEYDLGEECQHENTNDEPSWNGRQIEIWCTECDESIDSRDATDEELAAWRVNHPGRS
jgi:hypothetical protein